MKWGYADQSLRDSAQAETTPRASQPTMKATAEEASLIPTSRPSMSSGLASTKSGVMEDRSTEFFRSLEVPMASECRGLGSSRHVK